MQCYRSPRLSDTVVGLGALRHSLLSVFFFHGSGPHRHLHSFPTRRSSDLAEAGVGAGDRVWAALGFVALEQRRAGPTIEEDRKSTRLNSSHRCISYAVFCLKKKKKKRQENTVRNYTTT